MLSKIYGEAVLNQSKLPVTIVRPHNFYGPRMGMSHIIPQQLEKIYFGKDDTELEVFSVLHKRTFCYISDAVEIIKLLAENPMSIGQAYNVGNQEPEVTMQKVVEIALKVVARPRCIKPCPDTAGSPARRCPNTQKVTTLTGYKCNVGLEEGIQYTFDWYRKNIFEGKVVSAK